MLWINVNMVIARFKSNLNIYSFFSNINAATCKSSYLNLLSCKTDLDTTDSVPAAICPRDLKLLTGGYTDEVHCSCTLATHRFTIRFCTASYTNWWWISFDTCLFWEYEGGRNFGNNSLYNLLLEEGPAVPPAKKTIFAWVDLVHPLFEVTYPPPMQNLFMSPSQTCSSMLHSKPSMVEISILSESLTPQKTFWQLTPCLLSTLEVEV